MNHVVRVVSMTKDSIVIDSHVHLKHGDAQKTEYRAETIVEVMDKVGIDKSIVFAMSTTTRRSIDMARDAVDKFSDRLIPYVYALPNYERPVIVEIDEAISNLGFRGIKLHIGECTLERYVADPVLRLAGKYGVPCLIDYAGRYDLTEDMAERFPETKIIVAHLGKYRCRDEALIDKFIGIARAYDNIFLDVSGVVIPRKIREAVYSVGSDHVIFGTDGPAPNAVGHARAELAKIRELNLDPNDERVVLGGAISKLLRI